MELSLMALYQVLNTVDTSKVYATFKKRETGEITHYNVVKHGDYAYSFENEKGEGLCGVKHSLFDLVIEALKPVGVPLLDIKVFIKQA